MYQLQKWPDQSCKSTELTPECQTAFQQERQLLANISLLAHPSLELPTAIMFDASDTTVGGVFQLLLKVVEKAIADRHSAHPPKHH